MKHELEKLYETNIYNLRNIAREVGVKAPTFLKKRELINEILLIENSEKQPCIPSKKGRPLRKYTGYTGTENEHGDSVFSDPVRKKQFIDSVLKEIEKTLNERL